MNNFFAEELQKLPYGEHIISPWIDLGGIGDDSSLSFMIWIQARPEAASEYELIQLDLTHIALAAANKYGWEILRYKPVEVHHPKQAKISLDKQ